MQWLRAGAAKGCEPVSVGEFPVGWRPERPELYIPNVNVMTSANPLSKT